MTQIDEFESVFKSADKPVFHIQPLRIQKILLVTDEHITEVSDYQTKIARFLAVVEASGLLLSFTS